MDPAACFDVIRDSGARIATVARRAPGAPVPRYPGHDVRDLVAHVVTIHEWVARIVAERATTRLQQVPPDESLQIEGLIERFENDLERLVRILGSADPADEVWSFGRDRTVGFWQRRMAHETALHRWDADSAVASSPDPIPTEVAASGLGEGLHIHVARLLRDVDVGGDGERVALQCTDAPRAWVLTLLPRGIRVDDATPSETDALVRGTASGLWLAVTGRAPFDEVAGDRAAADLLERALERLPSAL